MENNIAPAQEQAVLKIKNKYCTKFLGVETEVALAVNRTLGQDLGISSLAIARKVVIMQLLVFIVVVIVSQSFVL